MSSFISRSAGTRNGRTFSRQRQRVDLVEEDGPLVGHLELSRVPLRPGPRERTPLVSEQFALGQLQRDRSTVDRHEGAVRPSALVVDRLGEELLPGPGLPEDEDVPLLAAVHPRR